MGLLDEGKEYLCAEGTVNGEVGPVSFQIFSNHSAQKKLCQTQKCKKYECIYHPDFIDNCYRKPQFTPQDFIEFTEN